MMSMRERNPSSSSLRYSRPSCVPWAESGMQAVATPACSTADTCGQCDCAASGERCGWSRRSAQHDPGCIDVALAARSEEHTSELQSLMRISYAVFCLKKKNTYNHIADILK